MHVPFVSLVETNREIKKQFLESVSQLLDSGSFILGPAVQQFEKQFAEYIGVKHCIGVSNGLDALTISLRCLNLKQGDEVIVPAHTYIATALAVIHAGAKPVFADVDESTFNITTTKIEKHISPRTKAVIPVHLYGQPCDMESICSLADAKKIFVVEDNAQAQGAKFKNRKTGSYGHINATSFYPAKNLGAAGDAGAITTNNSDLSEAAMQLRNVGSLKKYVHESVGYNARMDEIQALFLKEKLNHLDKWNAERRKIAALYKQNLKHIEQIVIPQEIANAESVFHLYVIRTDKRDELQKFLSQKNIQTLIHYPIPNHLQQSLSFLGYTQNDFPVTEKLCSTILSLPMYAGITDEQVSYVCEMIQEFFKRK